LLSFEVVGVYMAVPAESAFAGDMANTVASRVEAMMARLLRRMGAPRRGLGPDILQRCMQRCKTQSPAANVTFVRNECGRLRDVDQNLADRAARDGTRHDRAPESAGPQT
jgi:hypothetical protein